MLYVLLASYKLPSKVGMTYVYHQYNLVQLVYKVAKHLLSMPLVCMLLTRDMYILQAYELSDGLTTLGVCNSLANCLVAG